MMRKMLVVALLLIVGSVSEASAAAPVAQKCGDQIQKGGVPDLRDGEGGEADEGVLRANSNSDEVKKMGIQVAKLLQLPTACSLKNASITDCPKLLGIPAGSPEAAIFNNNASSTATPSAPAGKSAPEKASDSNGITKLGPHHAGLMATAVAIVFFTFPIVGSISNLFV
ncbi:non-specific lipid transfer protein GPI-anchored 1 [Prunus yedoensis var. nudiflora]|uniref:Non-specific lipid transfer protein GPI-anchored 1 n=1 Tax=Prunus yedoensis var. nudiflora TaxID=2094558 RepID=A0A314YK63_PRUYE|nr:non-specific lipid transfer protein GPI-anchored 1 [Prunus yedoensis var. nudiflora]